MSETLESVIREWVVKDYFTPNIKAEVILDTLLSKYIHELVEGTTLVAKEMSIPRGDLFGSIGTKIDYVLAGDKVYLIELKTTDSSDNDEQAGKYLEECQSQEKSFGDKIGRQLLSILNKKAVFNLKLGGHEHWTNETLRTAFDVILKKYPLTPDQRSAPKRLTAGFCVISWHNPIDCGFLYRFPAGT